MILFRPGDLLCLSFTILGTTTLPPFGNIKIIEVREWKRSEVDFLEKGDLFVVLEIEDITISTTRIKILTSRGLRWAIQRIVRYSELLS